MLGVCVAESMFLCVCVCLRMTLGVGELCVPVSNCTHKCLCV